MCGAGDDEDQEIARNFANIRSYGRYGVDNAPTADASPADAQVAPFYEKV